ncbi:hypothetical protein [Sulfolobus sp. E11-6]|uniref:hypothetical protein n=1 Tax=Sulfolobus sp. E11-6 TaxID=2663020 RepID=UPI001295B2BE|nr:hypothetical protein [Sulfolobus sp. E11-6]QGA68936.1 hypothetical protein GFS33_09610 [Sulfolobus sp. E11-6]
MVKEITPRWILRRLANKDMVLVSGLPFSGKTTTIRKLPINAIIIELPKEINSINELIEYKRKLSELTKSKNKKILVEGRNYVMELFLGKIKPREPSLENPHVEIKGNALTFHTQDIFDEIKNETDEGGLVKILEYSLITTPNYSTYIPKLIEEAKELHRNGKLDEILPVVTKFKEIYSRFPSGDLKGENAVLYPLISLFNSPEEMKGAWLKLTDTWKELIYYRIDSALRILPGKSKTIISNFLEKIREKEPKLRKWDNNYTPEFLEIDEYIATLLLNNKNVVLKGPIKTGKTTISREAIKNLLSRDTYSIITGREYSARDKKISASTKEIMVVDYHSDNYESLNHINSYLKNNVTKFLILTDDLVEVLDLEGAIDLSQGDNVDDSPETEEVSEREYEIVNSTRIFKYLVKNRKNIYSFNPRLSYYILRDPKITNKNINRKKLENEYKKDLSEYMYKVIFEEDPNLIKWYSPLIAIGLKYGFPIPLEISKKVLEYAQRKVEEEDILVKWFSAISDIPQNIKDYDSGGDIKTFEEKSSEIFDFLRRTIIEKSKSENLINDLLIEYSYAILQYSPILGIIGPSLSITNLNNYFKVNDKICPISYKIFENILEDISDYLKDSCKELPDQDNFLDLIVKGQVSESETKAIAIHYLPYYLEMEKYYSDIIGTIIKSNDKTCLKKALTWLPFYVIFGGRKAFTALEKFIFSKILSLKDEDLVHHYVVLSLMTEYRNMSHISEISKLSPMSRLYTLLLLPFEEGNSPTEIFANAISLDIITERALERKSFNDFLDYYAKFKRKFDAVKSIARKIDKIKGAKLASAGLMGDSVDSAIKQMEIDNDEFKMQLGILLFRTLSPEDDLKSALKEAERLSSPFYNYLISVSSQGRLPSIYIEEIFDYLQIRLANSLISGKAYEYKSVLNDFLDYSNKYFKDIWANAKIIAKLALNQDVEHTLDTRFLFMITLAALALRGKNVNEFFQAVESKGIETEDLEKLRMDQELAEVRVIYSFLKGENVDNIINFLDENGKGASFRIAHKLLKENDISRYLASLILFL